MKAINNSADCPNCGNNHKSKPYCEYDNGWHCFSCGYHKTSDRSFSESTSKRIVIPDQPHAKSNPYEFNIQSLIYLMRFHVTTDQIREYGIQECRDWSLIYPNIQDDKVVGYQRRWLEQRQILTYGEKTPTIYLNSLSADVVFVEDFISAIRVHELHNVVCLWGTKLSNHQLKTCLKPFETYDIHIWLDNDCNKSVNSGQVAAKKLYKQIDYILQYKLRKRGFGDVTIPNIYNIATDLDPKYYTTSEIREIIQGATL